MTFFFDVLPAMLMSTALVAASTAPAVVAGGTAAAFGVGLGASGMAALGFSAGVVGAGGAVASTTAALATGMAATIGSALSFEGVVGGISAISSIAKVSGMMDGPDQQSESRLTRIIDSQQEVEGSLDGKNQMKRLKTMVAGRNTLNKNKGSLLKSANDGGDKLGG